MAGFESTSPLYTVNQGQSQEASQTLQQSENSSGAQWRASYGQIAPIAQQWLTGQGVPGGQPETGYSQDYSSTGTQGQTPIIYSPNQYYYGSSPTGPYDTGTHGTPPDVTANQGPSGPAFNPGPTGGAGTESTQPGYQGYQGYDSQTQPQPQMASTPGGMSGNTYGYSPNSGSSSANNNAFASPGSDGSSGSGTSSGPLPDAGIFTTGIAGGLGAVAGKYLIPKVMNSASDRVLGTTSINDVPQLFSDTAKASSSSGGLFKKLVPDGTFKSVMNTKIIPDSWKAKFGQKVNDATDGVTDETSKLASASKYGQFLKTGVKQDAQFWQDHFQPQYATREGFQNILNSDSTAMQGLVTKSGLSAADATTLADLQYTSNQIAAAKATGATAAQLKAQGLTLTRAEKTQLSGLTKQSSLTEDETDQLANLNARRNLLGTPDALDTVNPKLFTQTDGPALLSNIEKGPLDTPSPFTADELNLATQQSKYFTDLTNTADTTTKDTALLARPGIGEFVKGGALLGGAMLGTDMLDSAAGGPNALHLDNYGLFAGFLAGDSLQQKALYMGGVAATDLVLDKILPASSHSTISNIMRPTGWDALMQGAVFFLPGDNQSKLAAMGVAFGVGRLANMNFFPSLAATGVVGAGTAFLLKADPEVAAGAVALEAGAWGVSRIMHSI